jgi:hypothetical protein
MTGKSSNVPSEHLNIGNVTYASMEDATTYILPKQGHSTHDGNKTTG